MGSRTQVMVVDDDDAVRETLLRTLRFEGYAVLGARDGQQALDALADGGIDAVVMDVLMPVLDGVVTCRAMRAAGDCTPVVLLTARDGVRDRVADLDAGADDYLTKPFALEELLARLRAVLRRSPLGTVPEEEIPVMGFADLELDPVTRRVARAGRHLVLTRTEFALLECFLRRPGHVLTREVLFEQVWGQDFGSSSNSLDVYIGYLRRKTEEGDGTRLLHTVRGVGFVLRAA